MEGGYTWTTTSIDVGSYVELWRETIADTRTIKRYQWDEYWAWLLEQSIAEAKDREDFDRHFTATNRQSAIPPRTDAGQELGAPGSRNTRRSAQARPRHCGCVYPGGPGVGTVRSTAGAGGLHARPRARR
jgi:hypothetical protein